MLQLRRSNCSTEPKDTLEIRLSTPPFKFLFLRRLAIKIEYSIEPISSKDSKAKISGVMRYSVSVRRYFSLTTFFLSMMEGMGKQITFYKILKNIVRCLSISVYGFFTPPAHTM